MTVVRFYSITGITVANRAKVRESYYRYERVLHRSARACDPGREPRPEGY